MWHLAAGELTSISARRKSRSSDDYSGVGANYTFLTNGSQSITSDQDQITTCSQELRYASPKWEHGNFVTGLYFPDEDGERRLGVRALAANIGALASATLAEQQIDSRNASVFTDGVLHLAPALKLTLGARHKRDEKHASLMRSDLLRPASNFSVARLGNA